MKSTIKKRTWKAIYRLLDRVSPVDYDCGKLCGAACCICPDFSAGSVGGGNEAAGGDEIESISEMGIYLYPGEHKIHRKNGIGSEDWKGSEGPEGSEEHKSSDDWLEWSTEDAADFDFPDSWHGPIYFVRCKTPPVCPRNMRPLQCRTYPLAPYITEDGFLEMVYNDEDLPYTCPLIEDGIPLNDDFVKATYTVWAHLIRDPLIYDLVEMDSRARDFAEENE